MPKGVPKNGINKGWFKKKERITFACKNCGTTFLDISPRVFCSNECLLAWRSSHPSWNKGIPNTWSKGGFEKGHAPWNKGKKRLDITGDKHPMWRGGPPKCIDCGIEIWADRTRCRECWFRFARGENSSNWKGGFNHVIKRRATLAGAEGSHTDAEWNELKKHYNYMCLCCKQQEPFVKLTEDHIVPLSLGGSNDISNIQPLCKSCNCRKHTKPLNYINNTTILL